MYPNDEKEIDLIDLFAEWFSRWRSLCTFLLIGIVVAGAYMYIACSNSSTETSVDTSSDLSSLTDEQLATLSLDDMAAMLTEQDMLAINELIALNDEYVANITAYEAQKDSMDLKDRAEALSYIATTKNAVLTGKNALTDDELVYYYYYYYQQAGIDWTDTTANTSVTTATTSTASSGSIKYAIIIILVAIFLHIAIVACSYIFNNRIKHSDRLTDMVKVPEFTRAINWDNVDAGRGLDRLVSSIRFSGIRRTPLEEVLDINASATIDKMNNKNYSSVAIVGPGLEDERQLLVSHISDASSANVVKSIDSITHSVNGADDIAGVDAAILAVRVAATRYSDFMEELQSLRDRDVDVIGIAVFE